MRTFLGIVLFIVAIIVWGAISGYIAVWLFPHDPDTSGAASMLLGALGGFPIGLLTYRVITGR